MRKYLIAVGLSKKTLSAVKKDLKRQGYSGLKTVRRGKWFDIYYTKGKKLKRVI